MTDRQYLECESTEDKSRDYLWENSGRNEFNKAYKRQAEFEAGQYYYPDYFEQ